MKLYKLHTQQRIPRSRDEVFAFFSKPENLGLLTPSAMQFRILTPTPIPMNAGTMIDYTIKVLGIRTRWTTLISSYEPPFRFVDEQLRGPYAFWHHAHTFRECDDGTIIEDEITYAMPFGLIGSLIRFLFVRRQLENIFKYRRAAIERMFSNGSGLHTIPNKSFSLPEGTP